MAKKKKVESRIKKLKKLEKKYVSVTEQHRLNLELARMNKMIILFGFFSAIALLTILFLVFIVFKVGQPLERQCELYVADALYAKTQTCNNVMKQIMWDYGRVLAEYGQVNEQLSPQCQQEIFETGIYSYYGNIVSNTKNYVVS